MKFASPDKVSIKRRWNVVHYLEVKKLINKREIDTHTERDREADLEVEISSTSL